MIVKPTLGRVLWYWPSEADTAHGAMSQVAPGRPMYATIVYVWTDRMVNLQVVDHAGRAFPRSSVELLQAGEISGHLGYAQWPPLPPQPKKD